MYLNTCLCDKCFILVWFSSPFIEERLYFLQCGAIHLHMITTFSSPFIEERLYFELIKSWQEMEHGSRPLLSRSGCISTVRCNPSSYSYGSRPLLSRSGCIYHQKSKYSQRLKRFSSPFIEERLYLETPSNYSLIIMFSSPFIEERLYFLICLTCLMVWISIVLVPFYRGAVVFSEGDGYPYKELICSRPLLSRSGCIY